jgi:Domain of unknown function (DUF6306)
MLEAERAGAKALVVFLDDFPRGSNEWKILRRIHEEEAHNCGQIGELLKNAGVDYSHATGEFYAKAVAVKGAKERIAFLVTGLRWAVKRFDSELPRLEPDARKLFARMRDSHLRSIAACETLLR